MQLYVLIVRNLMNLKSTEKKKQNKNGNAKYYVITVTKNTIKAKLLTSTRDLSNYSRTYRRIGDKHCWVLGSLYSVRLMDRFQLKYVRHFFLFELHEIYFMNLNIILKTGH